MKPDEFATGSPVKVFLSYGRRDAAAVADEVATFLVAEGFSVWRDRPEIKPGLPFLEVIEDAIHASDLVLALLSPHSVRRAGQADELDSVCLDELSFARFSKPVRPIVPAMAVPCDPPMVIYRLDYVDLTDQAGRARALPRLRAGIDQALRGQVRYRSWIHSLQPLDFGLVVSEKARDFVGRAGLHASVMGWLQQEGDGSALLLKADPGAGKSAFMASLIERNPGSLLGYHFCQAKAAETLEPGRFVRSIAAMVASRLPRYAAALDALADTALDKDRCEKDPFTAFGEGVLSALSRVDPPVGGFAFLLVDALDEALLHRGKENKATIVDLLADRLSYFPPWLRLVATTRKDAEVLRNLRGLRHEEIDIRSEENLADVEAYVRQRCVRGNLQALLAGHPQQTALLVRKMRAAGNFLFVAEMLKSLDRRGASLVDLEHLPDGLYGLYEDFFKRTFADPEGQAQLPAARTLLSVVLAAQQPLSEDELCIATGLESADQLPALLKLLSPYLPRSDDDSGVERYAVFHKSFADWLNDPELRGTQWYVPVRTGHRLLAAQFVKQYEAGVQTLSTYMLAHGLLHLGLAGDRRRQYQAVRDPAFVRTVFCRLGPVALLQIVDRALASFEDGPERHAVAALASAVRLSLPALAEDPAEFEVQLEARLRELPALAEFCLGLRPHFSPEVLVPLTAPLTPASGPLLLSLKAGFAVTAVSVDEAGNRMVTADEEGQLRVWWLDSGVPIMSTDLSPLSFSCGVADPAQPWAAFGSNEGVIVRLNLDTGDVQRCPDQSLGSVDALCLDVARLRLLSTHQRRADARRTGSVLACWSWPDLEPIWAREMKDQALPSVCCSHDGLALYLAATTRLLRTDANGENAVTLRKAPELSTPDPLSGKASQTYSMLALRADSALALGLDDGRIELLDHPGAAPRLMLPGHQMEYYHATVSGLHFATGDELVSAGWDGAVRVWNVRSGAELRSFRGRSKIYAFQVFDRGRKAVSGHKMLETNVWNLSASANAQGEGLGFRSLCVNPALGVAAACTGRRRVAVWDLATLAERSFVFDQEVRCVGIDAQRGEFMVLVGAQVRAIKLQAADAPGQALATLALGDGHVSHAGWSLSGQALAVGVGSKALVWQREGESDAFDLPKGEYTIFALSVSDAMLAVATSRRLRLHALAGKKSRVRSVELNASPSGVAFSPDGGTLAVFDQQGRIDGFEPANGRLRWRLETHDEWLSGIYLSNGGLVATTSVSAVCLYDAASGRRLAHLRSENGWADCWLPESADCLWVGGAEGSLHRLSIRLPRLGIDGVVDSSTPRAARR